MINLLLALFLILPEAVHEGLADRGLKLTAGIIEAIKLMVITTGLFLWVNWIVYFDHNNYIFQILAGYVLVRFSLFDIVYNLSRGVYLDYVGTTKLYDKIYGKITKKMPIYYILFFKFVVLCCGIAMLLKN